MTQAKTIEKPLGDEVLMSGLLVGGETVPVSFKDPPMVYVPRFLHYLFIFHYIFVCIIHYPVVRPPVALTFTNTKKKRRLPGKHF